MNKDQKITILQDLIKIDSENDHEAKVAHYLQELLKQHGIVSHISDYAPDRANLIAEIGDPTSDKVLALAGHLDTVSVGDESLWTYPPLSAEIHDGSIYGRGSADMKSGLAAMIIAIIELSEANVPLKGRVRFIGTVGEENGAMGSRDLTKDGIADDLSGMILGEPTGGNVVYGHNGSFNYTITSTGLSVHSSMPQDGVNALTNLVKFVNAESTAFDDVKPIPELGPLVHSVTMFHSGDQVNSIPGSAVLQGNIRPIPEFDNQHVIDRLNEVVAKLNQEDKVDLDFKVNYSFKPVISDPNSKFVTQIKQIVDDALGTPSQLTVIHGATDASEYTKSANQFPLVVLGSGGWDQAHRTDEHVEIENYLAVNQIYKNMVKSFLS